MITAFLAGFLICIIGLTACAYYHTKADRVLAKSIGSLLRISSDLVDIIVSLEKRIKTLEGGKK